MSIKKENIFVIDCNRGRIVFNPDGLRENLRKMENHKKVKLYGTTYAKPGIRTYSTKNR